MTLQVTLDEVPVSASNILVGGTGNRSVQSLPAAADGTGSIGAVTFDDPDGSLDVVGWQVVQVTEDDCVSAPTLFYGFVGDRTYQRGPYRDGAARVIDTSLIDHNTMLTCRIVTGGSANRPSETQDARLAWLLGTDAVVPMFSDLGLVDGTTKVLDAANYRGMYPAEVLADLCTTREEIFFTYWDQAAESVGLFFDTPESTAFTCSLTVSNVLSDVDDSTCFAPMVDGELVVDPQDVYSTGSMVYTGGTEYAINSATYAFFDAPSPILTRSFRVENDKVGRATTAHALLVLMLARDATERETLKFTVRLPSTKVGLVQAGMRISCRFSHLPGFETFAYTRIERLVYVPVEGEPTFYDVALECSTHGLGIPGGSGGGSTDPFPYVPPPPTASIVQQVSGYGSLTMPDGPVAAGDTLVGIFNSRGAHTWNEAVFGYTLVLDQAMSAGTNETFCVYKIADGTEGDTLSFSDDHISGTWYELPGEWAPDTSDTSVGKGAPVTAGPITVAANSIAFAGSAYGQGGAYDSQAGTDSTTPSGAWIEDYDSYTRSGGAPTSWTAHQFPSAGSLSVSSSNDAAGGAADGFGVDTTNWGAQIVSFVSSAPPSAPPESGKRWGPVLPNETPDGTTTVFTLPADFTWATGSLRVDVDRLDQTAAVTSEDGAASPATFTLGFAPKTGELVEVYGTEI